MSQLEYNEFMTPAKAGVGDFGTVLTLNAGEAGIQPGRGLVRTGTLTSVALPSAGSEKIAGLSAFDPAKENVDGTVNAFANGQVMSVVLQGVVGVVVEEAVTPADEVWVRFDGEVEVFTITFDDSLITGNVINGTINGVAFAQVTYASSSGATLTALAAAIDALAGVSAAVTDTLEITVTGSVKGLDISTNSTVVVTGGDTQAEATIASVSGPSTGTEAGVFRTDGDDVGSGPLALQITRAKFLTSTEAGKVALLQINLP